MSDIGFVWLVPRKGSIDWDATPDEDADDE